MLAEGDVNDMSVNKWQSWYISSLSLDESMQMH